MWNQKLCLGTSENYGADIPQQIKLIKNAGFDAVFFDWKRGCGLSEWADAAKKENLILQSVHAPFGKSADMWGDDADEGNDAVSELCECLAACAKCGAPIMIAHTFIGFDDHTPTAAGLERFSQVVAFAEKAGVKIAFENTEGEEYLAALMKEFGSSPAVGFCWDSGHEMCYNHSRDMLSLYGDNLICTHLNDNLGIKDYSGKITYLDDLHLLPFDGIADWDNIAVRLDKCGFDDIMTFELNKKSKPNRHDNDIYEKMCITDYFAAAFARACKAASKRKLK